jgi:uncharacterized membrane protein
MFTFPLLLTIYAGFIHAFEADHLLAVSNIVSQRNNVKLSLKDGIFWGTWTYFNHFPGGVLMIVFKAGISDQYFRYFESLVGVMLIALAVYRMVIFFVQKKLLYMHIRISMPANNIYTYTFMLVINRCINTNIP